MEHELTPDLRRLRSNLIAVCKVMGSRFPEFDVWREQAERDAQQEWAETQGIQKMAYEAGGDMVQLVRKLKAQVAQQEMEKKRLEAEVAMHERLLARRPSPRPMPGSTRPNKIGRNDPCPCGSGKKFKHCCMRT